MTGADETSARWTRVAAYALAEDPEGRILFCRLSIAELDSGMYGYWTLPGGGLDFGEEPAVGVLRELTEESGLTGEVRDIADIQSRLFPPHRGRASEMHAIRLIYRVEVTGGTLRDEVDGSTDRCAWFSPAEAADLPLVDLAQHALDLLARRREEPV